MNRLWFEDSFGNMRIIKDTAKNWNEVNQAIDEFISRCNLDKIDAAKRKFGDLYDESKVNLFKRYYTRTWRQPDGRIQIDVGSWSEFFIWEGEEENDS